MFRHFFKISLRRLFIDRAFSLINLTGLVIGISSVFLLSKYIGFHLTADDFQEKRKNIFAIHQKLTGEEGTGGFSNKTYNEVAPISKNQFPEVRGMSRFIATAETLVTIPSNSGEPLKFNERHIVEVDPDFIRMFTFHFLRGDPQTALDEPNSTVLTQSLAKKYFGKANPIGKTLTTTTAWGEKRIWKITGVIEDYPANSQFQFACLRSLAGKEFDEAEHGWTYPNIKSYLLLRSPSNAGPLSEKMTSVINGLGAFKSKNRSVAFYLVPLADETSLTKNQKLLILVGVVLLLITWINYTNLSGAKSLTRGKEFGVRRVLGSDMPQLIKQFLYEALLVYVIATVAVTAVVFGVYPIFFELSEGQLLPLLEFNTPINLVFLAFLLAGAAISSIYPSFTVYGLSVTGLLKNSKARNSRARGFQKFLMVFQFTISIIMLIGITTIDKQMQFIRNQEVGFDMDQILIVKAPKDKWQGKLERMTSFKNELKDMSFSKSVSSSTTVPLWWPGSPTDFQIADRQVEVRLIVLRVDEEYFNCYGLDLLAGEAFSAAKNQTNSKRVIVNEMTTRKMGFTQPEEVLHKKIVNLKTSQELEIIGVVRDHHHESLRNEIKPQVFEYNPTVGFVSVNLNISAHSGFENLSGTIQRIENIWHQIYPDQAFDYYFLDERFNNLYEGEKMFQYIFLTFTGISLIITFLGIFGLSMFIALRRRKEIGIRKTLGAKPVQIFVLFSEEFMKKAALSILIGVPIAYYLVKIWLSNFSYHISFNMWILIVPCFILLILTLVSISFECLKMAKINPVNILRDE